MALINESKLRNHGIIAESRYKGKFASFENKIKSEKNIGPTPTSKTVFMSHKHDEFIYLKGAIQLLKQNGARIYVDWMDESLPKSPNRETAIEIKKRISDCQKFILLATEGTITSKWCNWELGIGDVKKYPDNIALLPVQKDGSSWPGNEYLNIYPVIEESDIDENIYVVTYPQGKKEPLRSWLL